MYLPFYLSMYFYSFIYLFIHSFIYYFVPLFILCVNAKFFVFTFCTTSDWALSEVIKFSPVLFGIFIDLLV